jgi:hypothetical protein
VIVAIVLLSISLSRPKHFRKIITDIRHRLPVTGYR